MFNLDRATDISLDHNENPAADINHGDNLNRPDLILLVDIIGDKTSVAREKEAD